VEVHSEQDERPQRDGARPSRTVPERLSSAARRAPLITRMLVLD
jgi:hypothetical protein